MENVKTVLILGAGRGQVPIYNICKDMGCRVVLVTPKGDYPLINKAEVRYANVMDYKAVCDIAKKEKADAIITDQLDAGVFSCAYAAEKLGLRGIGSDVAKRFTNKNEMRKAAVKAGVSVPEFVAVGSIDELAYCRLSYPLVMKPTDNASSRGIFLIENEDELREHFEETKSYSSEGVVLLERFVTGTEYIVESYTKDYSVTNLIIGHSDYFDIPKRFVPKGRVFRDASIADTYIEKKVLEANSKLIKGFGLPFGITHGEFIYNKEEDEVYLVEIAARGGGEFISGTLIPLACGLHANEMMVKHALGVDYSIPTKRLRRASAYFSYMLPEGNIIAIKGIDDVKEIPGVYDPMFDNVYVGMRTLPIRDKASRKGPLLVCANTMEECYEIRKKIMQKLTINVETDSGDIKGIIWDKV